MILDLVKAFVVGGIICAFGQFLIDYTKWTPARILTGYVICGVLLSVLQIYEPILNFAGAGASVPLTGFGHLLATGISEEIKNVGANGVISGNLKAASGGLTAALLSGLAASFIFRSKSKS